MRLPSKIRFDTTAAPDLGQGKIIGEVLAEIGEDQHLPRFRPIPGSSRETGTKQVGVGSPETIGRRRRKTSSLTLGAHAAAVSVISAVSSPGDKIVFENLSYTQVSRSARILGRRTITVESDENGVIPEDFETPLPSAASQTRVPDANRATIPPWRPCHTNAGHESQKLRAGTASG